MSIEKSIGQLLKKGILKSKFLIGAIRGSVTEYKKFTIGLSILNGSHEHMARAMSRYS